MAQGQEGLRHDYFATYIQDIKLGRAIGTLGTELYCPWNEGFRWLVSTFGVLTRNFRRKTAAPNSAVGNGISCALRRELPRIPFAGTTGAEAHEDRAPDVGLKPGSSTVLPRDSGSDVEERRFSAASEGKKDFRALAPLASDADIFHTFAKAGERLAEIHV